jgi:phosphoribosylformylglycinamidine cyclo-ligase
VDTTTWEIPNVYRQLERAGGVDRREMFRTFNMGVGMVVIAPPNSVDAVIASVTAAGVRGWTIGRVGAGSGRVVLNEGD